MSKFTKKPYIESLLSELSGDNKAILLNNINGLNAAGTSAISYTLITEISEISALGAGVTPIEYKYSTTITWKGYLVKSTNFVSFITFKNEIDLTLADIYKVDSTLGLIPMESVTADNLRALLREDSYIDVTEAEALDNLPSTASASVGDALVLDSDKNPTWGSVSSAPSTEITWAELKALRDAGTLIPGMQYCITDYVTKINGTKNMSTSYNYATSTEASYRIIVVAITVNQLNENAIALSGTSVSSKKYLIKYCIDNDADRFDWADTTNGKGVIFWMKDRNNNEAPYDFMSIKFTIASNPVTNVTNKWTFGSGSANAADYHSSYEKWGFHNNVIKPYYVRKNQPGQSSNYCYHVQHLNMICLDVESNGYCENNVFEEGCNTMYLYAKTIRNNVFHAGCAKMKLTGSSSGSITANTFGSYCTEIKTTGQTNQNTFGSYCSSIEITGDNSANTFGSYCGGIHCGGDCRYNIFENYCFGIYAGTYFQNNRIGTGVFNINFGTSLSNVYNYCQYNIIENGNAYINIQASSTPSSTNRLKNIHFDLGVHGESSTNTQTFTVTPGLDYVTKIVKANSVEVIV